MITKGAVDPARHRWGIAATASAREAIARFVSSLSLRRAPRVMIPAYYGWSPTEGSGVIDPLVETGADVRLFRVTRQLHVDIADYVRVLDDFQPDVVVIIHYFGWVDPAFDQLVIAARQTGAMVLEDEAHSLLTTLLRGHAGAIGDASAYSLHKSLPTGSGGLLVRREVPLANWSEGPGPWMFDLAAIARARTRNAGLIIDCLQGAPGVRLLRNLNGDVVPLNVPVLVPPERRQSTYEVLNDAGFGVVCLYHRLGPGITELEHPDSFWLSARLVNLPCHQDLDPEEVPAMVRLLIDVVAAQA